VSTTSLQPLFACTQRSPGAELEDCGARGQFRLAVPLRPELPAALQGVGGGLERNFGSDYLLTFLDDEMLIGRQTAAGGSFIFLREA